MEDKEKAVEDTVEVATGSLSLIEGLKDAYIDHSRIIHPNKNISYSTLYEFVPATKIKGMDSWVSETEQYEFYKKSLDFPINVEKETDFCFPQHLNVYTYEKCNISSFPRPKIGRMNVLGEILL